MVHRIPCKIIVLCAVLSLNAVEAQPEPPGRTANSYIVQVSQDADPAQVGRGVVQRTRGRLGHVYTHAVRGFSVQLPPGLAKQAIEAEPGVFLAESDVQVHAVAQTLPTGVNRIDADLNSTANIDGVDERVDADIAIIDTGIDIDHPDLNVVGGRHFYSLWGLLSFEDNLYDDDNGHGSHCAGIAAAKDNGIGVVGVAPGARLWSVKVLDSTGSGYLSDVIAGLDWVTAHASTIEIANMSLAATASSSIFRTAVQNTVAAGVVCVVAAGNDAKDVYGFDGVFGTSDDVIPAAYPEAATISAMVDLNGQPGGGGGSSGYGIDDSFASFSNDSHSVVAGNPVNSPGKAIDLLMPGVNIYSCDMNGGYAVHSGTSMASPHAAGLVALYIASHGRATSATGVYAIRQALIDTGVAQTDSNKGLVLQNDFDGNRENIGWAGSIQTVPPTLLSVQISPESAVIQQDETQQYTAIARYSDNSETNVTDEATWESSDTSTAVIDSSGLATGVAEGSTIITATFDSIRSNEATLTVTTAPAPVTLQSILVEPVTAEIIVGGSQRYTSTGTYSDGTTADITDAVIWASSVPGVATIDASGLAMGIAEGSTVITAVLGSIISNSAILAVTPESGRIAHVTVNVTPLLSFRTWWVATAMVTVSEDGLSVSGATVEGVWSGLYNKKASNTTDIFGFISFETGWLRQAGTVTFTVTRIVAPDGQEYVLDPSVPSGSTTGP